MRARKASLSNQSFQTLGDNQLYGSDVNDLEVRYIFTKDGYYSRVTYTSRDTLLDFFTVLMTYKLYTEWLHVLSVIIACRPKSLLAVYTSAVSDFYAYMI